MTSNHKPARRLTRFFPLEVKLSQPNSHTHSRERENTWRRSGSLYCLLLLSLMVTNEHLWPLFIGKSLYKNSLELEASRISRSSPIFIPKYLYSRILYESSMEYPSREYPSRNLLWNIPLGESSREYPYLHSICLLYTSPSPRDS